jgi:hypothetical protein
MITACGHLTAPVKTAPHDRASLDHTGSQRHPVTRRDWVPLRNCPVAAELPRELRKSTLVVAVAVSTKNPFLVDG